MGNTPFKMKGFSGFGGSPLQKGEGTSWSGKWKAAKEAAGTMVSSSTISDMIGSYKSAKTRIRKEENRDTKASPAKGGIKHFTTAERLH